MFYGILINHSTHVRLTTIEGSSQDHVLVTWWLWLVKSRDWSCDVIMWFLCTCCHVANFGRKYTRPWHLELLIKSGTTSRFISIGWYNQPTSWISLIGYSLLIIDLQSTNVRWSWTNSYKHVRSYISWRNTEDSPSDCPLATFPASSSSCLKKCWSHFAPFTSCLWWLQNLCHSSLSIRGEHPSYPRTPSSDLILVFPDSLSSESPHQTGERHVMEAAW